MNQVGSEIARQIHVLRMVVNGSAGCRPPPDPQPMLVEPLFCRRAQVVMR